MAAHVWLCFAAVPFCSALSTAVTRGLAAPICLALRSVVNLQYSAQQNYGAQQHKYGAQQHNGGGADIVWNLAGITGVVGFSDVADACSMWRTLLVEQPLRTGVVPTPLEVEIALNINKQLKEMAADLSASGGSAASIYQQDYRYLPYTLRNGEMQVLSRWNMASQRTTVSRVQCKVRVSADGTATLTSCGKGPTLWRAWGGPWNGLYKDERHILTDGEQISLDWQEPEAAVFSCQLVSAMPQQGEYAQQGGHAQQSGHAQQEYAQQHGYTQQGYTQALPAGWITGVDQASGATYYFNEQTGQSQWEPPQPGGQPQQGGY